MAERIAITGLGVVSALGLGYEPFAENLAAGVSGLAPWSGSEAEPLLVGEVEPYDLRDYLVAEKGYLDRTSELALIAAQLCLRHAGLEAVPAARERRGLVVGTQFGCMATATHYCQRVRKRGPRFATPLVFSQSFLNTPASLLSIDYDLAGYHTTLTSGPESGRQALELGVLALALGQADAVLAGGVDALSAELIAGYDAPLATGDDPEAYVPGAAGGTALGEGAALLLLEREAAATARGATVWAWLERDDEPADWQANDNRAPLTAAPWALYGECAGASGALAIAALVASLRACILPPLRGGAEPLESRWEPQDSTATSARYESLRVGVDAAG